MVPNWLWSLPVNLIAKEADKAGLDKALVCAIIIKETSGAEFSARFEGSRYDVEAREDIIRVNWRYTYLIDHFAKLNMTTKMTEYVLQSTSWGPMQLMGSVARELGYSKPLPLLGAASMGIHWGCRKLKSLTDRYSNIEDAISSYNQGNPRKSGGRYKNQPYVDGVLGYMDEVTGS